MDFSIPERENQGMPAMESKDRSALFKGPAIIVTLGGLLIGCAFISGAVMRIGAPGSVQDRGNERCHYHGSLNPHNGEHHRPGALSFANGRARWGSIVIDSTVTQPHSGSFPGFHFMLQPMLGNCSRGAGRPASTASAAARISEPDTGIALPGV